MNEPEEPVSSETLTRRRLERHLDMVAADVTIPPSQPMVAERRARQRTFRRRRAAAAGFAVASVAGAVIGVRTLSEPTPSILTASDQSDMASAPETGASVAVTPDVSAVQADDSWPAAQLEEPAFVWKVVEPDKDRAVTGTFSDDGPETFPTLAISTAPGRSNDYNGIASTVWSTEDGIEWEQSSLSSPFSAEYWRASVIGDGVFAVGTAPGIAQSEPNPLQVATSTLGSDEWEIVELPIDTHEFRDLAMAYTGLQIEPIPLDDQLMIAVSFRSAPDVEAAAQELGLDPRSLENWIPTSTGIVVHDAACIEELERSNMPFSTTTVVENGTEQSGFDACRTSEFDFDELGLPAETVIALESQTTRFFLVDAELSVTEVASPAPGELLSRRYDSVGARFSVGEDFFDGGPWDPDSTLEIFEFDGVQWASSTESDLPLNFINRPAAFSGGVGGITTDERGISFATTDADGVVTSVDLSMLLSEDDVLLAGGSQSAVAVDGRLVTTVQEYPDLIAQAGGVELTVDGVTVRKDSAEGETYFVDTATGERIPGDRIRANDGFDESGLAVEILDADGVVRATFTGEQLYDELGQDVYRDASNFGTRSSILTTVDGVSFSVESVAELLDLEDDEVSGVQRIASDGETVVVAVGLTERHPDDTPKQLVLVGTPIG